MNDTTQQVIDNHMKIWDIAEDEVVTALLGAEEMLETNNYVGMRSATDGATRGQMIISVAGLILEQRRYYTDHAV
jgi:hypothetical protein